MAIVFGAIGILFIFLAIVAPKVDEDGGSSAGGSLKAQPKLVVSF